MGWRFEITRSFNLNIFSPFDIMKTGDILLVMLIVAISNCCSADILKFYASTTTETLSHYCGFDLVHEKSTTEIEAELEEIFARNRQQVEQKRRQDPEFYSRHVIGQEPKYFLIGCSDSRVIPEKMLSAGIGEVFVHRNVANQANPMDASLMASLEYAIFYLGIEHIIVVGHSKCGGIRAASTNQNFGRLEPWLSQIRDLKDKHKNEMSGLSDDEQADALIVLNIKEQMRRLQKATAVHDHILAGGRITIHGILYDLETGLIKKVSEPIHL